MKEDIMKRIIIEENDCDTIRLSEVGENEPIFAKHNGRFVGMLVKEIGKGWFLCLGGDIGATGYYKTIGECLQSCDKARIGVYYTFFV